jgi:catechol 2,3-dioxygenase-like lactoylglutathione lyase family enzyme
MSIEARLSAVGIVVSDMGKSLSFYRRLGLAVPADGDDQPHVEIDLGGGMRLLFDTEETIRSFHPDWRAAEGGARIGLALALPDPAAVDAAYDELTGAGAHGELPPFDAFWGQRYAVLHDPDGNGVDLFAPLAGR